MQNLLKNQIAATTLLMALISHNGNGDELSQAEREKIYIDKRMPWAKTLYQAPNSGAEEDKRQAKADALNTKIRDREIANLKSYFDREPKSKSRKEIAHRLALLNEQQSEIITRRLDIKSEKKIALQRDYLNKSVSYLDIIRNEFPTWKSETILFNLAENLSRLNNTILAEKYYREIIVKYPLSSVVADSLLALGNLYFDRQQFIAAAEFFKKIFNTPEQNLHPYAHYKIAWCRFNENNFDDAVNELQASILESRKIQQGSARKLGVEEEALSDLVLFYAEIGNPNDAKQMFEKLVTPQRAKELRYQLARTLFDHGKHILSKNITKQLLDEGVQEDYVNKLYLILISVAERTKDRDGGLKSAEQLAAWFKKKNPEDKSTERIETEEYLRLYSQKLHHEAETMKMPEIWQQARKSYEIYLSTFSNEAETQEVKFRYSVLLMHQKDHLLAYRTIAEVLTKINDKHARFKEALRLKIQAIEFANADEKRQIPKAEILAAYDDYSKAYAKEDLGLEAMYKAANLSKDIENTDQVVARFNKIVELHPKNELAKASADELLAVLVKAEKWENLAGEAKFLQENSKQEGSAIASNESLRKKISEAQELSTLKITERFQKEGKFVEAKAQYKKILSESPSENLGIYAFTNLALLNETKLSLNKEAIENYEELQKVYPKSNESKQAALEIARLYEKTHNPRAAIKAYLQYANFGGQKFETQALKNAAVLHEQLGNRQQAAEIFFLLAEKMRVRKDKEPEILAIHEAGCNNTLLSSYQNKDKKTLQTIHDCAKILISQGKDVIAWQARAAWALDEMADALQADKTWKSLANKSIRKSSEMDHFYIAMAKLRQLDQEIEEYRKIRFSKANEKPEANIGKKSKAIESIEKLAETIMGIGTAKQIQTAKTMIKGAYLEFAMTLEMAAVPSKLSDSEKEELRKSFIAFATDFRGKADKIIVQDNTVDARAIASISKDEKIPVVPYAPEASVEEVAMNQMYAKEEELLSNGLIVSSKSAEIYAKKAFQFFQNGQYNEAKYFSEKWKNALNGAPDAYGSHAQQKFQASLAEKLPDSDPLSMRF